MKNKPKIVFISIFLVLVVVLNGCSPQNTPTPSATPDTVSTLIASAMPSAVPSTVSATPTEPAAPTALSALVSEITGKVEIKQAEQDVFSPAQADSFLDENGQALTGSDGRLRLDLSTGTIVRVAPDSLFTLVSNEPTDGSLKTRLQLTIGKIFVILNGGSFEVETPTGTAAVRGSFMSVEYDSNSGGVKITCLEGHCALNSAGGTVEITAGQTVTITGIGQPPQIGIMNDEDIQDWLDNNPEAAIFVAALQVEPSPAPNPTIFDSPPLVYIPPVVKKTKEPQPTATPISVPTATPISAPTVVISSISPAGAVVGETITHVINVVPSSGGQVPTGTVSLLANGNPICTAALDTTGVATCIGGIASAGNFNLVANYLGDINYSAAQSAVWENYVVAKASTTITITSHDPNPSQLGVPVTFTATVDIVEPGAGTPIGSVTFVEGAYSCTATSAPWTCSINLINPGPALVTASYSGDANFNSSNSDTITQEVLLNSDTVFRNTSGPMSIISACDQLYKVDVLDMNGIGSVYVEYSINDNTFSSPGTLLLTKTDVFTWEATHLIVAASNDTVFWRFVATDGGSNQFFFGGTMPYFLGSPPSDFYSYYGIVCP